MRPCKNCGEDVTLRDDREGLIHKGPKISYGDRTKEWYGFYGCKNQPKKVAE